MSVQNKRKSDVVGDGGAPKKVKKAVEDKKKQFSKKTGTKNANKTENEGKKSFNKANDKKGGLHASNGDKKTLNKTKGNKTTDGNKKTFDKNNKTFDKNKRTFNKKPFDKNKKGGLAKGKEPVKPADWNEFKKQKKELRLKRREKKPIFGSFAIPKQLGEKIRCKNLSVEKRNEMIEKVHNEVKGKELYAKFVLIHDMARIVQILLKFGAPNIREDIIKELNPVVMQMLDSKYGKFVVKRMLKYSNNELRSQTLKAMYGNAVKLSSHALSAPIFEYAYSEWANPKEKMHFVQEFFGDMYKNSKDDNLRHLRDVYSNSPDMKTAALNATKLNLSRILNKELLDSSLVQTVLHQFLSECSEEHLKELISQLASHVVILSNSKDGVRVVMKIIWFGSNKDRKVAMKALKEHVLDLSKHENGHCSLLALLDAADDTVLLNKMIITELIKNANELVKDTVGRKVLLWLVAPGDSTHFHPLFIKELQEGREKSTCKKSVETRRKEILDYSTKGLLKCLSENTGDFLSSGAIGVATLAIIKTGEGEELKAAYEEIAKVICREDWKITENDEETSGIEHAGLHMILKKIAQNDKVLQEKEDCTTFGEVLLEYIDEILPSWLVLNRGCFFLVAIFENGTKETQNNLKNKLKTHQGLLKKQSIPGCKILMKKL